LQRRWANACSKAHACDPQRQLAFYDPGLGSAACCRIRARDYVICSGRPVTLELLEFSRGVLKGYHWEGAMIVVNMPGGAVQVIDKPDLLWLRKAFDSEWKGASMLQLVGERIYSIESVHELSEKFRNAKVVLAEFSAPDANKLRLVVSVKRVRQVIQSDPVIFHEKARSVLVFPGKLRLAVRETPEEARQKLSAETKVV
jgi:hypothetical protein